MSKQSAPRRKSSTSSATSPCVCSRAAKKRGGCSLLCQANSRRFKRINEHVAPPPLRRGDGCERSEYQMQRGLPPTTHLMVPRARASFWVCVKKWKIQHAEMPLSRNSLHFARRARQKVSGVWPHVVDQFYRMRHLSEVPHREPQLPSSNLNATATLIIQRIWL
jgi:hypothetical protein